MARFLRECRREAGLTLRQVQERTREVGEPIPSSTVCKIEQGKVEPGLVRVRALLDVYHRPLHEAANLLELEELVGPA
ncbi:MAG: XRE family transcriptional regulator, partial [Acidobacteria bacterium]